MTDAVNSFGAVAGGSSMGARLRCNLMAVAVVLTVVGGCSDSPSKDSASSPGGTASPPTTKSATDMRTTAAPWDRPADQAAMVAKAGLTLTPEETLAVHYHAHLDVIVDGSPVQVPAGLGINAGPNGELPEHGSPGIAPLHTHDTTGILHIEAPRDDKFTLGQVFTEWGVALSAGHVGAYATGDSGDRTVYVYVNGKRYTPDPTGLVLKAHDEIAVIATSDTHKVPIPRTYAFPEGL
jgi:hypothetical protein